MIAALKMAGTALGFLSLLLVLAVLVVLITVGAAVQPKQTEIEHLQRDNATLRAERDSLSRYLSVSPLDDDYDGRVIVRFRHAFNVAPFCAGEAAASTTAVSLGWVCAQ